MSSWFSNFFSFQWFMCHLLDTNENRRLTLKSLIQALVNVENNHSDFLTHIVRWLTKPKSYGYVLRVIPFPAVGMRICEMNFAKDSSTPHHSERHPVLFFVFGSHQRLQWVNDWKPFSLIPLFEMPGGTVSIKASFSLRNVLRSIMVFSLSCREKNPHKILAFRGKMSEAGKFDFNFPNRPTPH